MTITGSSKSSSCCVRLTVRSKIDVKLYIARSREIDFDVHYDVVKSVENTWRKVERLPEKCLAKCKECADSVIIPRNFFMDLESSNRKEEGVKEFVKKEVDRVCELHHKRHVVDPESSAHGDAQSRGASHQGLAEMKSPADLQMQRITEALQHAPKNTGKRKVDELSTIQPIHDQPASHDLNTQSIFEVRDEDVNGAIAMLKTSSHFSDEDLNCDNLPPLAYDDVMMAQFFLFNKGHSLR